MNTEKILKKLSKEQKPKVGSGEKCYKTLTAAVKAAERARDEACTHAEAAEDSAHLFASMQRELYAAMGRHERFVKRMVAFMAIFFTVGGLLVTFFCR